MAVATIAAIPLILLVSLVAQALVGAVVPRAELEVFRMGDLAVSNKTKAGDVVFPFVFFGALIITIGLARRFVGRFQLDSYIKQFFALEAVCATPFLVQSVFNVGQPLLEIVDSPVLLAFLIQAPPALFYLTWRHLTSKEASRKHSSGYFHAYLVLSSTVAFATLGSITVIRNIFAPVVLTPALTIPAAIVIATALSTGIALASATQRIERSASLGLGFTASSLLALPLLLPPVLVWNGSALPVPGPDPEAWRIVVSAVGVLLLIESLSRYLLRMGRGQWFGVPSIAIAVLAVPLRATYTLPQVPLDDYHFGESFSPFGLWQVFGQVPYTEMLLPRGILLNMVPGALNAALNDGSAAASGLVYILIALATAVIAHLLLRRAIGFGSATGVVMLMAIANTGMEGDLLIGALLVWTLAFALRRSNPVVLGFVLVGASAVAILAYPMMGIVASGLVGGAGALGLLGAVLSKSRTDLAFAIKTTGGSAVACLALALSPGGPLISAALQYVVSNGASNADAFGISLDRTWETPFAAGQIISMGFVLGFFVSIGLLWQKRRFFRVPRMGRWFALGVTAVPAAYVLVVLGRYLGRVDPSDWPLRLATGSLLVLGLIVPGIVQLVARSQSRWIARVSFVMAACISIVILPLGGGGVVRSAVGLLEVPSAGWVSTDAARELPTLGTGQGDPDHLSGLVELRAISNGLPKGQDVLNLTNRGALFGYMGWNNPIPYLAPYNIESASAESLVVSNLQASTPEYALFGPGPQHDGLSLTLRNPMLANWVMSTYTPIKCGDYTWGLSKQAQTVSHTGKLICPEDEAATGKPTDVALWAESIGAPADINLAPASWGARAGVLTGDDIVVDVIPTPAGGEGSQSFRLELDTAALWSTELLALDATCRGNVSARGPSASVDGPSRASISWAESGLTTYKEESLFEWGAGKFVVPLDAYPSWSQKANGSRAVQLSVPSVDCPDGWSVRAVAVGRSLD